MMMSMSRLYEGLIGSGGLERRKGSLQKSKIKYQRIIHLVTEVTKNSDRFRDEKKRSPVLTALMNERGE